MAGGIAMSGQQMAKPIINGQLSCDASKPVFRVSYQGPVSSKCLRQDFVLENVPGRFKDKSRVSSNSRNLGSSQILS